MKRLVELCVAGAKVLDLCVEGDELIEQGTGAVYNKPVKGLKVSKGPKPHINESFHDVFRSNMTVVRYFR